jgi:hypothetical protein
MDILDSKGDAHFDNLPGLLTTAAPPGPAAAGRLVVWRPDVDNLAAYDTWLGTLLKARTRRIVLLDELSSLCDKRGLPGANLNRLLKQNRSLGITVLVGTQETHWIPRNVLGQAVHILRFRLLHPRDAAAIDSYYLGLDSRREPATPHGYLYCNVTSNPRRIYEYGSIREMLPD